MTKLIIKYYLSLIFLTACPFVHAQKSRIKNLVNVKGVRANTLIGYGVVFGLPGTGDSSASVMTKETVSKMLTQLGIDTTAGQLVTGNYAAVIATAELPPFSRSGDRIDIRISANGDATSLAGGTLLLTQLKAGDGHIYAVAQGPVVVGQAEGSGVQVLTVARVPGGGLIEKEFSPPLGRGGEIFLSLKDPDFTSNNRISHQINSHLKGFYAKSLDPGTIKVKVPTPFKNKLVEFIALLEGLQVTTDHKAVVVLNERTGTVVIGNHITIQPVTIAHGDLTVRIKDAGGKKEGSLLDVSGSSVGELVKSLNSLGVKPPDLVGIFQALHAAKALHAELVFI